MRRARHSNVAVGVLAALTALAPAAQATAIIDIVDADGAGEGLNDTTPFTPTGGNPATTLGDARRRALVQAFAAVGCHIDSAVPIEVRIAFDPLSCTATNAVLANGGPATASRDFPNAPRAATYYHIALANALAGVDLDTTSLDVNITFNSGLGGSACLSGSPWYYGFDSLGLHSSVDLFTIAMHELTHGIGFEPFGNVSTGARLNGFDDVFMLSLSQTGASPSAYNLMTDAQRAAANISEPSLVWTGSHLVADYGASSVYAPNPVQVGSSVSHISYSLYPSELMSPFYTGPTHDLGRARDILADEGWSAHSACSVASSVPVPATPPWSLALLAAGGLAVAFGAGSRRRGVAA